MSAIPPRVVYDCNIFAQALINLRGPAARCIQEAQNGAALLFTSQFVLSEIRELHEKLPAKYGVTAEQTDELAKVVLSFAAVLTDIPEIYRHPFDPDDSHYVNLAARADARLIVSRDRHLLNLMNASRKEAQDFQSRFPTLVILDPVEFLKQLDEQRRRPDKPAGPD